MVLAQGASQAGLLVTTEADFQKVGAAERPALPQSAPRGRANGLPGREASSILDESWHRYGCLAPGVGAPTYKETNG